MLELLRREFGGRVVVAVATDRTDGDMHPLHVDPERLRMRQLEVTDRHWVMVDEVHGLGVHHCSDRAPGGGIVDEADVVVAARGLGPVAVWAADCAPVALFDGVGTVVACHAGWRGLAAGVLDVAAAEVVSPVLAVLGPCIHQCCYEFGAGDLELVADGVGADRNGIGGVTADGRAALDLPAAVRSGLARHGIELAVTGPCTGCDDRWFSHRVRADVGRHAVVAWSESA